MFLCTSMTFFCLSRKNKSIGYSMNHVWIVVVLGVLKMNSADFFLENINPWACDQIVLHILSIFIVLLFSWMFILVSP